MRKPAGLFTSAIIGFAIGLASPALAADELLTSSDYEATQIRSAVDEVRKALEESTAAMKRADQAARDLAPVSPDGAEDVDEAQAASGPLDARIVNGVLSARYPSVGHVLKVEDGKLGSWCTGTLIGCRTFVTAQHCVEDDTTPGAYRVFFQHAGLFKVTSMSLHEEYDFPYADLAVFKLDRDVTGIRPTALYTGAALPNGTSGKIVGFGRTGGMNEDYGLKRIGTIKTSACDAGDEGLICWKYDAPVGLPGEHSNTCNADSGGPLLTVSGSTRVLAGVTSGGLRASQCLTGDRAFDVDVRLFADWIKDMAGADLGGSSCASLPRIGSAGTRYFSQTARLAPGEGRDFKVKVPANVAALRIAMNGEDLSDEEQLPITNFDLFVKRGAPATSGNADCKQNDKSQVGACEVVDPAAGDYFLRIQQAGSAAGDAQVVVSLFMKP